MPTTGTVLQLWDDLQDGTHYLSSTPENVLWGALSCAGYRPVLGTDPGADVTIDTMGHEGILEDQGQDLLAFFGSHGVSGHQLLMDAVELAASVNALPAAGSASRDWTHRLQRSPPRWPAEDYGAGNSPSGLYDMISSRHGR